VGVQPLRTILPLTRLRIMITRVAIPLLLLPLLLLALPVVYAWAWVQEAISERTAPSLPPSIHS
jgi:hypothetical protein